MPKYQISICYDEIGGYTHIDKVYEYDTIQQMFNDLNGIIFSRKYGDCNRIVVENITDENEPKMVFEINMENVSCV